MEFPRYFSLLSSVSIARAHHPFFPVGDGMHWLLDVTFSEDESRFLSENAHTTMNALRKFALTVHKNALAALGKKRSLKANIESLQKKHEGMKQIPHLFALLDFIHNRNVPRQNCHR